MIRLDKRKVSGREKDEATIHLLERLREKLYADNPSAARRAAHHLSWMQEDGLDILKEALFSRISRTANTAAAYGLRKMHGRMKKAAMDVFKEGLEHNNGNVVAVCRKALLHVIEKTQDISAAKKRPPRKTRFVIRDIRANGNVVSNQLLRRVEKPLRRREILNDFDI